MTSASPARVPLSRAAGSSHRLRLRAVPTDFSIMNTFACRAVAQAGSSAATASLDDEAEWPRC